jgi:hypothetical protein
MSTEKKVRGTTLEEVAREQHSAFNGLLPPRLENASFYCCLRVESHVTELLLSFGVRTSAIL